MRRLLAGLVLLLAMVCPASAQRYLQATAHITSQTTTTVLTSTQATRAFTLMAGSICVDSGGATTAVTIQDSAGLNLFGPGIVWPLAAGTCLNLPYRGFPFGLPAGKGTNLQVVTTVGNGPVEVYLEVVTQ